MVDAALQSIKIVIVKIHLHLCLRNLGFHHLRTAVLNISYKLSHRFCTHFLLYEGRQLKINEDQPFQGGAVHYVIRFDVQMEELPFVHHSQWFIELFRFECLLSDRLTWFNRNLNTLWKHQHVKPHIIVNFRSDF